MKAEYGQLRGEVQQLLDAGAPREAVIDKIARSGWSVQEFTALNKAGKAAPSPVMAAPEQPQVMAPIASPAAPRPQLLMGDPPGRAALSSGPTKPQTDDLNKALKAKNNLKIATDRIRDRNPEISDSGETPRAR